jgi:glutamyl-tRNA synthetase
LFAKKHGGTFCLRIEDTDRIRYVEGAVENMINALDWAGIRPDEGPQQGGDFGPYYQSKRTDLYRQYAQELIEKGKAYYAFDTPDELENVRQKAKEAKQPPPRYNALTRNNMKNSLSLSKEEVDSLFEKNRPYVIRLKVPQDRTFEFNDIVRGPVSFNSTEVDDQILLKSDGFPTYHLANVVDDYLMEISHVIRGEEWLSSVPKHLLLYECFGWEPPSMAHLPLIFNPDGTKMSKRDITSLSELPSGKVDPDVQTYMREGFEKEAIVNYIALLGWNPGKGEEQEIFTKDELVQEFSLERVNKSAAIFDIKKLEWINGQQIFRKDVKTLAAQLQPIVKDAGYNILSDDYFLSVVKLLQTRLHFAKDIISMGFYFFTDPKEYDAKAVKKRWKTDSQNLLVEFVEKISKLDLFDAPNIEKELVAIAEKNEVGYGKIIHPVRLVVTGKSFGAGLYETLVVLGKETVVRRLEKGIEIIPTLK